MKQTPSHPMGTEQVSAMVDGELSTAEWQVLWDDASSEDKDRVLLQLAGMLLAIGLAPAVGGFFLYNVLRFGSPLESGYALATLPDWLEAQRKLGLFSIAPLTYALVTVAWRPIRTAAGWLLLPMGQRALFAYAVQLFVVAFASVDVAETCHVVPYQ